MNPRENNLQSVLHISCEILTTGKKSIGFGSCVRKGITCPLVRFKEQLRPNQPITDKDIIAAAKELPVSTLKTVISLSPYVTTPGVIVFCEIPSQEPIRQNPPGEGKTYSFSRRGFVVFVQNQDSTYFSQESGGV